LFLPIEDQYVTLGSNRPAHLSCSIGSHKT